MQLCCRVGTVSLETFPRLTWCWGRFPNVSGIGARGDSGTFSNPKVFCEPPSLENLTFPNLMTLEPNLKILNWGEKSSAFCIRPLHGTEGTTQAPKHQTENRAQIQKQTSFTFPIFRRRTIIIFGQLFLNKKLSKFSSQNQNLCFWNCFQLKMIALWQVGHSCRLWQRKSTCSFEFVLHSGASKRNNFWQQVPWHKHNSSESAFVRMQKRLKIDFVLCYLHWRFAESAFETETIFDWNFQFAFLQFSNFFVTAVGCKEKQPFCNFMDFFGHSSFVSQFFLVSCLFSSIERLLFGRSQVLVGFPKRSCRFLATRVSWKSGLRFYRGGKDQRQIQETSWAQPSLSWPQGLLFN